MKNFYYFVVFILLLCFNFVSSIKNRNSSSLFLNAKLFETIKKNRRLFEVKNKNYDLDLDKIMLEKSAQISNLSTLNLRAWMKYLELSEDMTIIPSNFKKNPFFCRQKNLNSDLLNLKTYKADVNSFQIPSEDYFLFELNQESIKVYSSLNIKLKQLIAEVSIKNIMQEISLDPFRGGVEDIGNFKEGFCFIIKFKNDIFDKLFIWEICSDTLSKKQKWMQTIIQYRYLINESRNDKNNFLLRSNDDSKTESSSGLEFTNILPKLENNMNNINLEISPNLESNFDLKQEKIVNNDILNESGENVNQCFTKVNNTTFIKNYCKTNFKDQGLFKECSNSDQFCYICCDREVGTINRDELNCCYKKCNKTLNK